MSITTSSPRPRTEPAEAPATSPAPSAPEQTARAARRRDPWLDEARYLVMLLVVTGHALSFLLDASGARGAYTWIYAFHMPVFVLISGYVSRSWAGSPRQVRTLVTGLLIPYVALNVGLDAFRSWLDGDPFAPNLLDPAWTTWFLIALALWRLSTPLWSTLRAPLAVALAVSVVAGLWQVDDVVAVHRVLGLLPFYVAGLCLRPEHLELLRHTAVRVAGAVVLVASLGWVMVGNDAWTMSWLYWRDAYADAPLEAGPMGGVLTRSGLLVLGFLLSAAVLAVTPRRSGRRSEWGTRTMNAYVLHGFVLLALDAAGVFDLAAASGALAVPVVLVGSALLGTALMSAPIDRLVGPVISPRLPWLFREDERREEDRRGAGSRTGDAPSTGGGYVDVASARRRIEERDVVAAARLGEGRRHLW
ncbi:fucose 4-O-acetylase-like acetyltransferase [Mumia flava]|uniref:Fucose 4-O-acetylase-like acetyltransferase n=1 Tax=Mumia flava TaxID=1348852 RepID=A0A2M9BK25_9ACTN|nr:acyltransferase family protein [Mumia flava]PJJ58305.1 fucose 4-O-acetylase-like acetyltransferase [Mumia flava]